MNLFGIAEDSRSLIVAVFDDKKGAKTEKFQKLIRGTPVAIEEMRSLARILLIKKVYQVNEPANVGQSISDLIVSLSHTRLLMIFSFADDKDDYKRSAHLIKFNACCSA